MLVFIFDATGQTELQNFRVIVRVDFIHERLPFCRVPHSHGPCAAAIDADNDSLRGDGFRQFIFGLDFFYQFSRRKKMRLPF